MLCKGLCKRAVCRRTQRWVCSFSVEITQYVDYGEEETNVLAVYVDSTERADIPPFGGMVDYLCYGGIYRDVTLRAVPHCHIESVYARPVSVLTAEKSLQVDIAIAHSDRMNKPINILIALFDSRNKNGRSYINRLSCPFRPLHYRCLWMN